MSVENEQIIPVQVKYVEVQSATVLRNEKIPSSSARIKKQEPRQQNCEAALQQNGLCQSPVAEENIDVTHGSPVMSPGAASPTNPLIPNKFQFDPNLTYAEKVAHEMIVTEKIYLDNLKQIIDGFLGPVTNDADLDICQESIDDLFINVEEIYQFNWVLLQDMERCNFDPVKLAECFVLKQIGFDIYTKYCTHYPRSMEVLLEWNQREDTANFIKRQQESLGHTLPLCSFLLKPVQRILKYHLLLGNIAKHFKQAEDEDGFEIIQKALSAMTNVAKHINDMKRKHEDAVHLQEIESVLLDYEGPNLTSFGSIVLEDTFRLHGTKTGRYLLLFEKALLITKRRSDGTFSWKATVMYSNMMLADSVFREPLTFQVIPFDDRKICYTFVSRDLDTKQMWLLELKRRLLDSYAAAVPMKAKQIILGNGREDCEKENAEPGIPVRRSTPSNNRKGANQQRAYSNKDSSGQSAKLSKNSDPDRRKSKDPDETTEEKTRTPIDSIKSPLRRKLRVFTKKRKFTKEPGKSSKRVSWSSDDNNDESFTDKERLSVNKEEDQETKVSDSEPYDVIVDVKQNDIGEVKYLDNNDNVVSISSLLRDGKTMVSVTGEEDNHLSGHVKDIPVLKRRRLTREKRQKCKSMPAGEFPNINEDEATIARTHSASKLYEKFLESELLDSPTSVKELQKYGLVNLREHPARTKRLGSYDEIAAAEGNVIHRSSDKCDVADDVIAKPGQSVHQTMKRVSAAFSDISPTFSPDKSPSSSTEELMTNEDITAGDLTTEDFTPGDLTPEEYTPEDLTPDEYTPGDLTPEDDIPGDLSPEDSVTGSSIPGESFTVEIPQSNTEEGTSETVYENGHESECDKKEDTDKNMGSELEYSENMENGVNTDWNQTETADNEDSEAQSRHSAFHSEPSSYADTLSDSFDENDDDSWPNIFDGSYQRVFSLKRSYSEENLVSKTLEGFPLEVASKSCTHMNHAPVTRSKSAGACSTRPQSLTRPLTFSVTPKKKIVIKDSPWETIKEDVEVNHHEVSLAKDVHTLRRRRKKKSGHKKNKKNKTHTASIQHLVRTCASLNMADYRPAKNEGSLTPISTRPLEGRLLKTKDDCEDIAGSSEETNNDYDTIGPHISEKTGNNCDIVKTGNNCDTVESHSSEEESKNYNTVKSNKSEETENSNQHPPPLTKIAVALRKKNAKPARDRSLVRVDRNVSEVPSAINYLCIEAVPSDESPGSEELPENYTRDVTQTNGDTETCTRDAKQTNGDTVTSTRVVTRTNGNTASKVERLSKYFNEVKMENNETSNKHNKQAETPRNGRSIKKRLEELSRREMNSQKSVKNSEEKLVVKEELNSLQNIQDRIGVLRRSTSDENPTAKAKIELTSSLNHGKPNVQQIRNRLEECSTTESGHDEIVRKNSNENGISKKSTSLRIKDRIEELAQYPASNGSARANGDKKPDKNVDDDLRSCKRLKERIERLQKGAKREVSGRDITISDDKDTSELLSSPRENEELRTVVIKRGWVQQFIQKIETGS